MSLPEFLEVESPPPINDVIRICNTAQDLLSKEGNVARIRTPVTIVGDLHGQFHDLQEILNIEGSESCFLFLGDYVDRGQFSIETLMLLLLLKIRYPHRITLLRGNHESRQITQVYGFYDEVMRKYGNADVWIRCTSLFDYLPLAAVVTDSKAFAVHAGLSPQLEKVDELESYERFRDISQEGTVCDLLWSDPADDDQNGWSVSPRGAGFVFGSDVVEQFNRRNDFRMIVRSHQLVMKGFKELFRGSVTTVWSAPNYMNRCGNSAAILRLGEETDHSRSYIVFGPSPASDQKEKHLPDYFL